MGQSQKKSSKKALPIVVEVEAASLVVNEASVVNAVSVEVVVAVAMLLEAQVVEAAQAEAVEVS